MFISLAKSSCLGLCYSWITGRNRLRSEHMANVILGWRKSFIDDNCTVCLPEKYLSLINGGQWKVEIKNLPRKTLADLPDEKDYVVFYSIDGKNGHFVVANKRGVVFNPLDYSNNVIKGKPINYRYIRQVG